MIPITDETPTRAKSPLKSQKKLAKLDIKPTELEKGLFDGVDNDEVIDSIIAELNYDDNAGLKSGEMEPISYYDFLEKTTPYRALARINKLTIDSMKLILKAKNVSIGGLKLKQHYIDTLLAELGIVDSKEKPDLRKTPVKEVAIEEKNQTPEIGAVKEKVGRIETGMDKREEENEKLKEMTKRKK
jgi:hypothetical protein